MCARSICAFHVNQNQLIYFFVIKIIVTNDVHILNEMISSGKLEYMDVKQLYHGRRQLIIQKYKIVQLKAF